RQVGLVVSEIEEKAAKLINEEGVPTDKQRAALRVIGKYCLLALPFGPFPDAPEKLAKERDDLVAEFERVFDPIKDLNEAAYLEELGKIDPERIKALEARLDKLYDAIWESA